MRKLDVRSQELQRFQQYGSVVKLLLVWIAELGLSCNKPRSVNCLQKDINVIILTTSCIICSVGHLKRSVFCKLAEETS